MSSLQTRYDDLEAAFSYHLTAGGDAGADFLDVGGGGELPGLSSASPGPSLLAGLSPFSATGFHTGLGPIKEEAAAPKQKEEGEDGLASLIEAFVAADSQDARATLGMIGAAALAPAEAVKSEEPHAAAAQKKSATEAPSGRGGVSKRKKRAHET